MLNRSVYRIQVVDDQSLITGRIVRSVTDLFNLMMMDGFLRPRSESGGILLLGPDRWLADGEARCLIIVGQPRRFSVEDSYQVAVEKFTRLFNRRSDNLMDLTAWSTRDPAADPARWGGAIAVNNYILSFSGLSEHADETLLTGAAILCGMLDEERARALAEISDNRLTQRLLDHAAIKSLLAS